MTTTITARTEPHTRQRPGFGTTVRVEFAKLVDTRGAHYLGLAALTLTLVFTAGTALTREPAYSDIVRLGGVGVATILLAVACLAGASEYQNRSVGFTYLAEPDRARVLAARAVGLSYLTCLSIGAIYLFAAVAAPVTGLLTGRSVDWQIGHGAWGINLLVLNLVSQLVFVWQAYVLGLLLLNGPAAVVVVLVQPMIFSMIATTVPGLTEPLAWFDPGTLRVVLGLPGATATQWGQVATGIAIWLVLPAIAGAARVRHTEVN